MLDWRENWGTKRVGKITIRDWLNAAVVSLCAFNRIDPSIVLVCNGANVCAVFLA